MPGIRSRGAHRVRSCYSPNRWGSDLKVPPFSKVRRFSSRASEDPHAEPPQDGQRIARYPGHHPLGQADPWNQTEKIFRVPEIPVVSDPPLLIHTQSSEDAELEVHRAGEVDPSHRQFRLRVRCRCEGRQVEIRCHGKLPRVFIGMRSFSFVKTGKEQDVERVFNDCTVMTIKGIAL